MLKGPFLKFFSERAKKVSVAGDFNEWCGSSNGRFDPGIGKMLKVENAQWIFSLSQIPNGKHEYKFIVDGEWEPGANRFFFLDESGNLIDLSGGIETVTMMDPITLKVQFSPGVSLDQLKKLDFKVLPSGNIAKSVSHSRRTEIGLEIDLHTDSLDVSIPLSLEIRGLSDRSVTKPILLDGLFKKAFVSNKNLGMTLEGNPPSSVFRLFAPRANKVTLRRFSDPRMETVLGETIGFKDPDGVWEMRLPGTHWGTYYGFLVEGPIFEGEGFQPSKLWPDPYAKANVYHDGPSILIDPVGEGFQINWTDAQFKIPRKKDLVVWESSIRDLTSHTSAQVSLVHRGKYLGLIDTVGTKVGVGHMKALGINAVEFLPPFEFDDTPHGSYHWGYMTSLFFSPEASYSTDPHGSQVKELKLLINALHENGIAVLFDVVYNHTGSPHNFMGFDKKYFYRHDGNLVLRNFSGCGNDFNSENPMARRLILDSLEYWVREFHVDGFRFDLAELIDLETLASIERSLHALNPDIILIAEPWSFRGTLKGKLKGTSWSSWNDDFRNRVKEAVLGNVPGKDLFSVLSGSIDIWAKHPLESVNYVESHDDFTLIDHLCTSKNRNGSNPTSIDIRRDLFCAAAVLLSPGIPMLAQGQEMLRSKKGNPNSYNAGDLVNSVDYSLRDKFPSVFCYYRDLIKFRLSSEWDIIRNADEISCKSVTRIDSSNNSATGLLWKKSDDLSTAVIVLFNPDSHKSAHFKIPISHGIWERRVGENKVYPIGSPFARQIVVTPSDNGCLSHNVSPLDVEVWVPRKKKD